MSKDEKNTNFLTIKDRIEQTLLERRIIFISEDVNSESAKEVIMRLWYLRAMDAKKPILLVINSPGGSVDSGFAIFDQARLLGNPIQTLVTGLAASMGSVLLLASPKGSRYATKETRIMVHQPLIPSPVKGVATDLEIHAKEILKTHTRLIEIYKAETGNDKETLEKILDRDSWFSAEEALKFGLIDKIITSLDEIGF